MSYSGLKVTGGKRTEDGHLSAFVTKVKRGSIADVEGHLKTGQPAPSYVTEQVTSSFIVTVIQYVQRVEKWMLWRNFVSLIVSGDEVIEWNGRPLRNLTFDEVYDIIFESKQELQVELIVQRSIGLVKL